MTDSAHTPDLSAYPRVHDCIYSWCKERRPECDKCDFIVQAAREAADRVFEKAFRSPPPRGTGT